MSTSILAPRYQNSKSPNFQCWYFLNFPENSEFSLFGLRVSDSIFCVYFLNFPGKFREVSVFNFRIQTQVFDVFREFVYLVYFLNFPGKFRIFTFHFTDSLLVNFEISSSKIFVSIRLNFLVRSILSALPVRDQLVWVLEGKARPSTTSLFSCLELVSADHSLSCSIINKTKHASRLNRKLDRNIFGSPETDFQKGK